VPINILIIGVFMTNAQRVFTKQAKTLAMLNGNIEEIYTAHNIVKVFNAQESSYEQFAKKNNNLYKVSCASQILNAIMMPVMFIITNICQALIISVGVVLCVSNRADLGLVIAFISYFHIFNNSFSQIAQQLGQVLTCTAAAERIGEFLTSPEIKEEGKITKTIEASKLQGNISFKKIKFGYEPKRIIINDFSLDVKKGQKIAIVGPTGAGKTTIVNLLMRFYDLNKGTITIDGVDFHQIAAKNVRALFAMILQDT
jgi:ATP-binding cassette subfamily B protein